MSTSRNFNVCLELEFGREDFDEHVRRAIEDILAEHFAPRNWSVGKITVTVVPDVQEGTIVLIPWDAHVLIKACDTMADTEPHGALTTEEINHAAILSDVLGPIAGECVDPPADTIDPSPPEVDPIYELCARYMPNPEGLPDLQTHLVHWHDLDLGPSLPSFDPTEDPVSAVEQHLSALHGEYHWNARGIEGGWKSVNAHTHVRGV